MTPKETVAQVIAAVRFRRFLQSIENGADFFRDECEKKRGLKTAAEDFGKLQRRAHKALSLTPSKAEAQAKKIHYLVEEQAKDEGLWFRAETGPEGYLQQELRKLHAVIEEAGL